MMIFMMLVEFVNCHDRQIFHRPILRIVVKWDCILGMDSGCSTELQIILIFFKFIVMGQSLICHQSPHPFSIDIIRVA